MDIVSLENVTHLAEKLPVEEQLVLVEKLAQNLRRRVRDGQTERRPQNLYGIWRRSMPKDFDIDAALIEIRGEYKTELEENS
ncbi:MAG: hypothetical protein M3R11_09895 [Acidobacteriota bacterium]|jgi:hypothetical protein|nr:hypothetical protein [Acidobacteriota bacterium]